MASPIGSVLFCSISPQIRVRTRIATVTLPSRGSDSRCASTPAIVAVVAALRYARAKRVTEVAFRASGVSSACMVA